MKIPLLAALGLALLADTSPRRRGIIETRWKTGAWTVTTNDEFIVNQPEGDTVALQIRGGGESAMIRRRIIPLSLPCTVTWKIRWTDARHGNAYPSLHLIFDPPPLDDDWWKAPIQAPAGGAPWAGERNTFLFHFATDEAWRRAGMTGNLEKGPSGHDFNPPQNAWLLLRAVLERDKITVLNDRTPVFSCDADLSTVRTFALAFGDQTSTRVELDEFRVDPGR